LTDHDCTDLPACVDGYESEPGLTFLAGLGSEARRNPSRSRCCPI